MDRVVIGITGTPGTGKSEVSKILAKKTGAKIISISALVKREKFPEDKKRKTKIVSILRLRKIVKAQLTNGLNIIEGHLAHFYPCDISIVLRTNPIELKKRLKNRKWPKEKINENVEAEIIGEILIEALENQKNVFEIDTSKAKPEGVAVTILKILKGNGLQYKVGRIDWTKRYARVLINVSAGKP